MFELAKELGVDHRELLRKCDELRVRNVRNYMSVIDARDEQQLRQAFRRAPKVLPDSDLGMIRRRRKRQTNTVLERSALEAEPDTSGKVTQEPRGRTDPWRNAKDAYQIGDRVSGKVVSLADFGAFVELEVGVEALLHVSEMSWTRRVNHPSLMVAIGDTIEAIVVDKDWKNKRISLGMKQLWRHPWVALYERFPVGTRVTSTVTSITDFGIFIDIEEATDIEAGIRGLIHLSDLSWTERIQRPSERFKVGDEVEAVVLKVDVDNERMSLGIKQLTPDPWEFDIPESYAIGRVVTGRVTQIHDFGAFVELRAGVEALIHVSEMSVDRVQHPSELLEIREEVVAQVISMDREERKIGLSLKAIGPDPGLGRGQVSAAPRRRTKIPPSTSRAIRTHTQQLSNDLRGRVPPLSYAAREQRPSNRLSACLSAKGLLYPATYSRRFLCAALAARDLGALVLLAGTTGTGKTAIARNSAQLLTSTAGRVIAVRPEWLQASDLLGYVNPLRRLFAPSAFVHALREAGASDDALYLLLLDEMNLARIESYGADVLATLEQQGAARRLALYPPDQNALWLEEKRALKALADTDRSVADDRRLAELDRFFATAGGDPAQAHQLPIPDSLVVLGTLNTDAHTAQLSPKVIDRSFVLQSTPPGLDELFAPPPEVSDASPEPVDLPERRAAVAWDALPFVRDHFRKLLAMLAPFGVVPTRRMARNAAAYLGYARHEGSSDADLLADLIHLLILPRIVLPIEPAERLLDVLQPWISKNAPALDPEVAALRRQVDDGRHGDVRGLR